MCRGVILLHSSNGERGETETADGCDERKKTRNNNTPKNDDALCDDDDDDDDDAKPTTE